jgi:hypothetical protein
MLDKATILTTIFTRVDDTMKGSAVIQHALKRPGPAPHLSDSELITIALYQELIGEPREDHFFRLHQASLQTFFPGRNSRSRYNRRKHDRLLGDSGGSGKLADRAGSAPAGRDSGH